MVVELNGCIFLTEDDNLLKEHNEIWDKVSNSMEK